MQTMQQKIQDIFRYFLLQILSLAACIPIADFEKPYTWLWRHTGKALTQHHAAPKVYNI